MYTSIPPSTLDKFTSFGELLRFLRRRAGMTQMELSIAVGYSEPQISRLEQGLRLPDIPVVEARFISALCLEDEPHAAARLLELAATVRREDAPSDLVGGSIAFLDRVLARTMLPGRSSGKANASSRPIFA